MKNLESLKRMIRRLIQEKKRGSIKCSTTEFGLVDKTFLFNILMLVDVSNLNSLDDQKFKLLPHSAKQKI